MTSVNFDNTSYSLADSEDVYMPSRCFDVEGRIQMMPYLLRNPILAQDVRRVSRKKHVGYIGDSHGNYTGFLANMAALWWKNGSHYEIPSDHELVILGDVVADRNMSGLQILHDIALLRNHGAQIDLIAWNHEDLLISFFFQRNHANSLDAIDLCWRMDIWIGLLEFGKFQGLTLDGCTLGDLDPEKILSGMRLSEEWKDLLETLSTMEICTQIDDTLFIHTDMTDEMAEMLLLNEVKTLNDIFQANLRSFLFCWIQEDDVESFHSIRDVFLSTYNSRYIDFDDSRSAIRLSEINAQKLKQKFHINRIIHGHTDHSVYDATGWLIQETRSMVVGALEITSADHSAFKDGSYAPYRWRGRSVGIILPNGTRYTHHE